MTSLAPSDCFAVFKGLRFKVVPMCVVVEMVPMSRLPGKHKVKPTAIKSGNITTDP